MIVGAVFLVCCALGLWDLVYELYGSLRRNLRARNARTVVALETLPASAGSLRSSADVGSDA